jgi:hypothetical protein
MKQKGHTGLDRVANQFLLNFSFKTFCSYFVEWYCNSLLNDKFSVRRFFYAHIPVQRERCWNQYTPHSSSPTGTCCPRYTMSNTCYFKNLLYIFFLHLAISFITDFDITDRPKETVKGTVSRFGTFTRE